MNRRGLTNLFLLAIRDWPALTWLLSPLQAPPHMVAVGAASWDAEYTSGKWQFLDSLAEQAHHLAVASYVAALKPNGRVLDVGCGSGALQGKLKAFGYTRYLGIDISEAAIAAARPRGDDNTAFVAVPGENFTTGERFDAIVFNESLYYFADHTAAIDAYAKLLAPDGILIISMALSGLRDGLRKLRIWRHIAAQLEIIDETVVFRARAAWIVKAASPLRRDRR
jgi:SAM-dependent methyltransferase